MKRRPSVRQSSIFSLLAAGSLCLSAAMQPVEARPARVVAPAIAVTPAVLLPHGAFGLSGTGFDPSTAGKLVTVAITIVTSSGTFPAGDLPVSAAGIIGSTALRLPSSLDVTSVDQVLASEDGNPGLAAGEPIRGTGLQPAINGGIAVNATSGSIISLRGSGFAPLDTLTLTVDGQALATAPAGSLITDESGNITYPLALPATMQSGHQLLTLTGTANGLGVSDAASLALNVRPAPGIVGISPNPAVVGTSVGVQANGFQANEQVTFSLRYFDTGQHSYYIVNAGTQADLAGTAEARISVPGQADPSKPGTVTAHGVTSELFATSPLPFVASASLNVSPRTAIPGSRVTISGDGFVPGENLFITTRLFQPPIGTVARSDATGHFTATVTLYASLQGGTAYPLSVSGTGGDFATASFLVAAQGPASLQITPTSAAAGASVLVSGQGFGGSEPIAVTFAGNPISLLGPAAATDATGTFTATALLPSGTPPGSYLLQAAGATSGIIKNASLSLTLAPSNQWFFAEGFTGQGPSVFFHETLTLLNTAAQAVSGAIVYQLPDGSTHSVPASVQAHGVLVEDVNADIGPGQIVSAIIKMNGPILAERAITRTDAKGQQLDTDFSPGQSSPQTSWYFPEGYSGVTFQPYLTVQNPMAAPISMTVTLFPTLGAPVAVSSTLVAFGRYTLNLRGVLPGKSFSTSVVASQPLVAERVEYWGDGVGSAKYGAGVKPGVSSAGKDWYFGYASVLKPDQSFVSVLNPGTQIAHVTATVNTGSGRVAAPLKLTVSPGQRGTYQLHVLLASLKHSPVALHLTSDVPVVAEEAQYYAGSPNIGKHAGASIEGRQFTAGTWSFASGDTKAYSETEYLYNPSPRATNVTGTFYGVNGQVVSARYAVPSGSVITVSANLLKSLIAGAHGSVWTASDHVGIVVVQLLRGAKNGPALADQGIPG